ncbi:hypothetical protein ZL58_14460 [Salmonella enterica subsp. enterica serovar Typhimurium]|nr:hypothetical protein [Salmonella enterica subsp. enterica serovar Typhimurium]
MKWAILFVCAILTACSAPETPVTVKMDLTVPPMPGALRRPCAPIPDIQDEMDMGLLLKGYGELVDQYTQCRLLNQAKIDWLIQNGL